MRKKPGKDRGAVVSGNIAWLSGLVEGIHLVTNERREKYQ
jgi:hypothetical protein